MESSLGCFCNRSNSGKINGAEPCCGSHSDLWLLKSVVRFCEEKSGASQCSRSLIGYGLHILVSLTVSYGLEESDLAPTESAKRLPISFCGK